MDSRISVVIPMKNMELYIKECMDSILNSSLQPFEIIVVDFGSTDNSVKFVREYMCRNECIRLLIDENGDAASSRNVGLHAAQGDYIVFIDCDDWIAPNMLYELFIAIEHNMSDVVCCGYNNVYMNGDTKVVNLKNCSVSVEKSNINKTLTWMALGGMGAEIWTKLYRTSFLKENGIIFESENGIHGEDVYFNYCVLLHEPKIQVIDKSLYFHRIRNGSISRQKSVVYTSRFITIITNLLKVAEKKELNASIGIAQLLLSLLIQDITACRDSNDKKNILLKYINVDEFRKLYKVSILCPGVSLKRRILAILMYMKLSHTIGVLIK